MTMSSPPSPDRFDAMNGSRPRTVNLGRGQLVPYPEPTSAAATKFGRANRRTDTKPEQALRRELHRTGLRFRKDHLVRAGGLRTRADIVFGPARVAVFVDGCYWHMCSEHFKQPKRNVAYWEPKLAANVARDRRVDAALAADGWTVLRVWEHEPIALAAARVVEVLDRAGHVAARRARGRLGPS